MIAAPRRGFGWPAAASTVRWASAFAWLAAVGYLLLALGFLGAGDLQPEEGSAAIVAVAAACYALGGVAIGWRRRGLWLAGAVANALVVLMFFSAYADRPAVLLSGGGLVTKSAQVLLELALLALIARRR